MPTCKTCGCDLTRIASCGICGLGTVAAGNPVIGGTQVAIATTTGDDWVEAEFAHKKVVRGSKLETLYVQYKSNGNWAVIGTIGDRDIIIKTCACERDANDWLEALQKKLS